MLPTAPGPTLGRTNAPAIPPTAIAPTIGPTGIATSLDNPSPRPPVRAGDGPFQAGQQISPRYTILKLLGTGGMGAVYQAFDHELGVAVAIKVIRPAAQSDATAAKELEQRFKRELVLARHVTHKYVVRIHDLGEIDGIKYLTMPFVEGETLSHVMRRAGRLPLARVIKIAQQVAQGLAAAHEKGVVHRDLKPENIMLEAPSPVASAAQGLSSRDANSGDALIMDFGIARSVEAGATQTAAGSVIGTLEYMAPEQAQGRKVDQRADQYAFGLIVYDMLVGRQRLTSGDNPMTELLSRLKAVPPAPRAIDPAIPEPLDQLVMKCLQPEPAARFATTQDLVNALDRLTPDGHLRSDVHEVIVMRSGRPAWQLAAAALIIVALAGTAGWVVSNGISPDAAADAAAREPVSVLVADFENKTGDPVFDGVVEQAVSLGIEGAGFITTFPRRDAMRAAAVIKPGAALDEATARLVAQREGISTVVVGDISPNGSGYQIRIRGVGPGTDAAVRYELEDDADSKADVLATVGALANQVRVALGDTATPAPSDAFTTASLEAASAYAQAQDLQAAGRREEAIRKYTEAISLDPNFGRAYSGIAAQYEGLGRFAEARENYDKALQFIDRMSEREKYRTRGLYYLFNRKPEQAVEEFTTLLKAYPADSTGLHNLALARFYLRDLPQALEQGRKAAAIQPRNIGRRTNVALYAMYAGQYETAITESNAALELNPSALKALLARALSEVGLGKIDEAAKTYAQLSQVSAEGASYAAAGLADIAIVEGRHDDAIAILEKGIAADIATKNIARAAAKRAALAEARRLRGDTAGAVRDAQAALIAGEDDEVVAAAGLILARLNRAGDAEKAAGQLEMALEADPQAYGKLVRAELALAQGQPRRAVDLARDAEKLANTWLGHLTLGRAYLALEAYPDAYSEFETTLKRGGEATALFLDDVPTYRYFPQVHYYQGRAQEGIRSPAAAQSYKTFLAFMKNPEGSLAADARARLAKLGS
jgi:tetratricopeptide (TPR) repeat protein/tRNA A-37 threonylcarbamoyl transferase component Bud32